MAFYFATIIRPTTLLPFKMLIQANAVMFDGILLPFKTDKIENLEMWLLLPTFLNYLSICTLATSRFSVDVHACYDHHHHVYVCDLADVCLRLFCSSGLSSRVDASDFSYADALSLHGRSKYYWYLLT